MLSVVLPNSTFNLEKSISILIQYKIIVKNYKSSMINIHNEANISVDNYIEALKIKNYTIVIINIINRVSERLYVPTTILLYI